MSGSYQHVSKSAQDTYQLGFRLADRLEPGDTVLLFGALGAGKTQFAKGVAAGLGIQDEVLSPTFNIVLEYDGRIPLSHFDLYRLEDAQELEDVNFYALTDEDSPGVSLVEWPDAFVGEMPEDAIEVVFDAVESDDTRLISLSVEI